MWHGIQADEDFDTFDDDEISFVIETTKPKIALKGDCMEAEEQIPFLREVNGSNRAVRMSVRNLKRFTKLKQIAAEYLVINMALENRLKPQKVAIPKKGSNHPGSWINQSSEEILYKTVIPPYRIPDMMRHFYLNVNNGHKIAPDLISVLLDNSLLDGTDNSITVEANRTKEGEIAFRIPQGISLSQLSLHYYDTAYGNIVLPIYGQIEEEPEKLSSLPMKGWKKMHENFSLRLMGYRVADHIGKHYAKEGGQFEIIDVALKSNVNAVLKFDPATLFSLDAGGYGITLHPISREIPLGVYTPVALAPGVTEQIRMVFYVPKGLENAGRLLRAEVEGDDIVIPVKSASVSERTVLAEGHAEGITVQIHRLFTYNDKIGVEMTFVDEKDGRSTRLHLPFYLHDKPGIPELNRRKARQLTSEELGRSGSLGSFANHRYKGQYSWYKALPQKDYILGMDEKTLILDGTKRTVVLWFDNQFDRKHSKSWHLVSTVFKDLDLTIDIAPPALTEEVSYAVAKRYPYRYHEDVVTQEIRQRVAAFRAQRAKTHIRKPKVVQVKAKKRLKYVEPLGASYAGRQKLKNIRTVSQMIQALSSLKWVPSAYEPTAAIYSPSSILTQGWGSENEMFRALYEMVKERSVKFGSYRLTAAGKSVLSQRAGPIPVEDEVPFLEWQEDGKNHSLVFPFLKPEGSLSAYLENKTYLKKLRRKKVKVKMLLTYTPANDGSSVSSFGMFGSALGGASSQERKDIIFEKSWDLATVSDMPIDIFFPKNRAYYIDANGTHADNEHALSFEKVVPLTLQVEIVMPDGKLDPYLFRFGEKALLQDIFLTLGIGTPDLEKEELAVMEKMRRKRFHGVKEIDAKSRAIWLNHSKLYRFIGLQTAYENDLARQYGIEAKRNRTPRVMMAVLQKKNGKLKNMLDLRRVFNDTYGDSKKCRSFNIMSAFFNAEAEAQAVIKGEGAGSRIRKSKHLVILPNSDKSHAITWMQQKRVPKEVIARYEKSRKMWLFPLEVREPLAWFEADPQSYRMVPVLQNGMYGSMTESDILEAVNNEVQYFVGLFAGIAYSEYSVTVFTIIDLGDHYCRVRKEAEALSNYVACILSYASFVSGIGDDVIDNIIGGLGTGLGCAGQGTASKAISWASVLKASEDGTLLKMTKTLGGFANGFGDGVSLYFNATNGGGCQ
jgi:hypothetical protein